MKGKTIRALMVPPGGKPCETVLLNDPTFLTLAINLGIPEPSEMSWLPLEKDAGILYNRDAALWDQKGNRRIGKRILSGNFYIIGRKNGTLASLTEEQIERYYSRFFVPESISDREAIKAYFDDAFPELMEE